jgi:ATP:ADP antiporter, AAA family
MPKTGRGRIERFLSLFADVHRGEGPVVLLLTLNIFLILTCYYVLKVVREPLILLGGVLGLEGATLKAGAAAGQAILLVAVVPAYSALANRVNRIRLINVVTVIFVVCLVTFFVLARAEVAVGLAFFIFLGIFNLMVIAQFWSYANDLYTVEAGKRLFAIVAFGQTFGAVVGSGLSAWLFPLLGAENLMLVAAVILGASLFLTNVIQRKSRDSAQDEENKSEAPIAGADGFKLVLKNRYLLYIGLMLMVLNLVNTDGEFILGEVLTQRTAGMPEDQAEKVIGQFYGGYLTWVSVLTALLQLFVVSRVLKHLDVRWALMFLPAAAVFGYSAIILMPLLPVIRAAKIVENSLDYSLQNTTRQALFLPTSRAEKYQAKAAIDSFFVRFGDVLSFGVVFVVTSVLGLGVGAVAVVNVVLIAIWVILALAIGQRYKAMTARRRPSTSQG